ncbi:uncharacterized protein ATC70_013526 [Mucor velutinosus]|uniref:Uncharacterized protein n=1 Tax=Mucor velutinosus TaxID=708070 RepID=A0AAN7D2U4_9FUNG|nr:hypothetical protein ATC70_013526 [Mucor velutinosus]
MSNRSSFEQPQEEIAPTNNQLHVDKASTQDTPVKQDEKVEAAKANDEAPLPDFEDTTALGSETADNDDFSMNDADEPSQTNDPDFDEFGEFDDGFVDAADNDDDDFGDFDDFEQAEETIESMNGEEKEEEEPKTPTEAELYVDVLENRPNDIRGFIDGYLDRMWGDASDGNKNIDEQQEEEEEADFVSSPLDQDENATDILNTPCSRDLWSKLSRDTVFYNPMTGSVGQFQWTRSETNKAYLNALGVTFNFEEKSPTAMHSPTGHTATSHATTKKRQTAMVDGKRSVTPGSAPSSPDAAQTHTRSASATGGLRVVTAKMDEGAKEAKKEAEQEMELDIDIARAYCELTEETIRVFPDVKLNAMVIELNRLQKQAADYLDNLLDQKEQLKMDAETYNDLISCIVGHAQRLHVQTKDASPAMVSKKKKANGTFSNLMRRKTTASNPQQSVSMGGGVVGVKQQAPTPKRTVSSAAHVPTMNDTSRRSM